MPTVSVPPLGMARSALSQRFQNTCLILFGSTRALHTCPLNARTMLHVLPDVGLSFHQHQRFIQQARARPLPERRNFFPASSSESP